MSTRKDVSVTFSRKAIVAMAGAPQRVLLMGGTRFIGEGSLSIVIFFHDSGVTIIKLPKI